MFYHYQRLYSGSQETFCLKVLVWLDNDIEPQSHKYEPRALPRGPRGPGHPIECCLAMLRTNNE